MIIKKVLLILGLLFIVSCQRSEKEQILHMVEEWIGKEIKFPVNSVFTIGGKDTVDFNFSQSSYKIVVYTEEQGCLNCRLQLSKWKELINETDSLDLSYVFYFSTTKIDELQHIMQHNKFVYPICWDKDNKFNQLNHLPTKINFHTFLLDKDNRIVSIGNPIYNQKVRDIYLKILKGKSLAVNKEVLTTATLDTNLVDFGKFSIREGQKRIVKLRNTGEYPLVIYGITTSCGCLKVKYDKSPIVPGKETEINLMYEGDKSEYFRKTITIHCNTNSSPICVVATGRSLFEKE